MNSHDPHSDVPAWIAWPVRAIALVLVMPFRLLWELVRGAARYTAAALSWAGVYLIWLPLRWISVHLLWRPAHWAWTRVLRPPLRWVLVYLVITPIAWVTVTLIYEPLRLLARTVVMPALRALRPLITGLAALLGRGLHALYRWLIRPVGVALAWAWHVVGSALAWAWRYSAVPVGRALAWLWRHLVWIPLRWCGRAVAWTWRHTVVPVARAVAFVWAHTVTPVHRLLRDSIWRPAAAVTRDLLISLGLRRY